MASYAIKASPVFTLCVKKLNAFLTRKFGYSVADKAKRNIKHKVAQQLSDNPYSAPISERLSELGVLDYRQLQVDEHNIVFYRIEEDSKTVVLLLVIDARQGLGKLLFELNLVL